NLEAIVGEWPLLDRAVELLSGTTTIRNKPHLQIRGVKLRDALLREQDHIVATSHRGTEYYEIAITPAGDQLLPVKRVLSARSSQDSIHIQSDGRFGFVCGNIEIVI